MNEEKYTTIELTDSTTTLSVFHPILNQQTPATPKVEVFDDRLKKLADSLLDFTRKCETPKLAGLAANQLALNGERVMVNMCVVMQNSITENGEMQDSGNWIVAVNPEIYKHTESKEWGREGCLTWPGKVVEAERYLGVSVKYQDLDGNNIFHSATDFEAAVWQHEINHLLGIREIVINPKNGRIYGQSLENGGTIVNDNKVGRNDPCYCGSGKKYKKCCCGK